MATSTAEISRNRGDTTPFTVTVTQESDGSAVDISGYSFIMTVDPSPFPADNTTLLFSLDTAGGEIVISDAPNGVITITLDGAAADQSPGDYYYDIQMTDGAGAITTILKGGYEVIQDITK